MNSGCSESTASGSHASEQSATASWNHTSRPSRQATAFFVRRTTTTDFTPSRPSMASSTCGLSGSTLPRRQPPSAVITHVQPPSTMRSRRDCALKPAKTTECGAPMRAQASIAIAASGIIGR